MANHIRWLINFGFALHRRPRTHHIVRPRLPSEASQSHCCSTVRFVPRVDTLGCVFSPQPLCSFRWCDGTAYQNFPHVTVTAVHPGHVGTDIARLVTVRGCGGNLTTHTNSGDVDEKMDGWMDVSVLSLCGYALRPKPPRRRRCNWVAWKSICNRYRLVRHTEYHVLERIYVVLQSHSPGIREHMLIPEHHPHIDGCRMHTSLFPMLWSLLSRQLVGDSAKNMSFEELHTGAWRVWPFTRSRWQCISLGLWGAHAHGLCVCVCIRVVVVIGSSSRKFLQRQGDGDFDGGGVMWRWWELWLVPEIRHAAQELASETGYVFYRVRVRPLSLPLTRPRRY